MAEKFIIVRDTRTDEILPNPVPENFLELFKDLKEVPSSRNAESEPIQEPIQPGQEAPASVITEPAAPAEKAKPGRTPIKEEGK